MFEYLSSGDDVIAVRSSGRMTRDDVDGFVGRLDASFAAREKTHLFAEVVDFSGFDPELLGEALKRTPSYLGNLRKIGRVGIVADQDWIRWLAKAESALLPHVSYETFKPHERDRALAWVKGENVSPHAPAIKLIETNRPDVLGFELNGHVGKDELDTVSAHFLKALEGKDNVSVFGRVRDLGGFQVGGLVSTQYFEMKRGFLSRLKRYAVVGGPAWLKTVLATLSPMLKGELRHFEADDEASAWEWLGAKPVAERTLIS